MAVRNSIALGFLVYALVLNACSREESKEQRPWVELPIGSTSIKVELALTRPTQSRGLMFRDRLPEDQGMLFVFQAPQRMSFWMRNTRIPLDIGYFTADGQLREVYPLYPYDENSRKSIRDDLIFALEANQGWFKSNGVEVGDRIDLDALKGSYRSQ